MPDASTLPTTERRSPGSFEYYNAGALGGGADLYVFTCWDPAHENAGTHSVYASALADNIAALEASGRINRTDRHEYWDWTAKSWLQGCGARRVTKANHPGGLPISSTTPLSYAEREALREMRRRYQLAADAIDECLAAGARVDRGLDCLHRIAEETDGLALRLAAKLGSNR